MSGACDCGVDWAWPHGTVVDGDSTFSSQMNQYGRSGILILVFVANAEYAVYSDHCAGFLTVKILNIF